MIYRDSLAEARARIDALECENKQLVATNHELSYEVAASRRRDYALVVIVLGLTYLALTAQMCAF